MSVDTEPVRLIGKGAALSPGVAEGSLLFMAPGTPEPVPAAGAAARGPEQEVERFSTHLAAVVAEIGSEVVMLEREARSAEADILRGQAAILDDPEFRSRVHAVIQSTEVAAERALEHVVEEFVGLLEQSGSDVMAQRVADVRDLAMRLKRRLQDEPADALTAAISGAKGSILAVSELLPSVVLQAWRAGANGFVVEQGTGFSHSTILARSFGLPIVRVPALHLLEAQAGRRVLVDGTRGEVLLAPTEEVRARVLQTAAQSPASDRAALPVRLWVNILMPEQLEGLDWADVTGVGLYRTETLFIQKRRDFPDEEEQVRTYRRLFELAAGRPVTVRTVDIGGDKPVPYMSMGPEENPQLGLRAHRLFRFHPEILLTQLRAILRAGASHEGGLRLLHPMVEGIVEWRLLQGLAEQARQSLTAEGAVFAHEVAVGPLIEVPAAVWGFPRLIAEADFASVGTNDLVQYLLAVDRSNANVADLYRPDHPVVLDTLTRMAAEAREAGKPLSLCGEVAAEPAYLPLLVGMGYGDLSVSASSLDRVRGALRALDVAACQSVADDCLGAETPDQVAAILQNASGSTSDAPG